MNKINFNKTNIIPNKVICIGRNYVEHIKELNNEIPKQMVIFFKPNSCVSDEIKLYDDELIHFEGELSFLLVSEKLVAVSFGLDLTKRGIQSTLKSKGLPWERAKAFRGSAVFCEFVGFSDINSLRMELHVNNKLVQEGGVSLMINKPDEIIKEVLTFSDICDGDILMSGTPKGVGQLKKGDELAGYVYEQDKLLVSKKWFVR